MWLIAGTAKRTSDPESQPATPSDGGTAETATLIALFVLATFASYLPFFIAGRYRVPIIPFLLLFGAYRTHELGRAIAAGKYRTVALQAVLLTVLLGAAHIRLVPYEPQPAQRHLLRATCYRLADKIDLAIEECRAATELDPNSEEGHRRLADLLMLGGDPRQAAIHYQHAARLRPNRIEVQYNLAMALVALGDHDRAIDHLRWAVQIQPEAAEAHYRLAGLLRREGQIDAAIASYKQTIECHPDHVRARRDLAALLLSQRQPQEALVQLRWIADRGDASADVHNLAGVAWKLVGSLDEAVASYRRALAIDPDYYLAHNNIANVLAAQGRSDEAIAHYRRALEIKPGYTQAREGLNDILRAQRSSESHRATEEISP